jgi:hypothetical protein
MLFLIVSIVVFNGIAFLIPKQMSRVEIYASALFAVFLEYIANYALDFINKLYGYFEPGIDVKGFIVVLGIYPAVNTIFLNFFPHKGKVSKKFIYLLGFSLFSLFYEWLSEKSSYFYHSGWTYIESLIAYPILWGIIIINFKLIRNLIRRES